MNHTVLLVDDDPNIIAGLTRVLRNEPYEIVTANSAIEAAELVENNEVDLVVSDEEMPGMSGTEFLARLARDYPDIVGIVLTGHPTLPTALRALNEGQVYRYFTKPCNEIDLAVTIRRALEQKDLKQKSHELLEVTKRQSALIEEARMLRRLRGLSPMGASEGGTDKPPPGEQRGLLEAIDQEIRRGEDALRNVQSGQHGADDVEETPKPRLRFAETD